MPNVIGSDAFGLIFDTDANPAGNATTAPAASGGGIFDGLGDGLLDLAKLAGGLWATSEQAKATAAGNQQTAAALAQQNAGIGAASAQWISGVDNKMVILGGIGLLGLGAVVLIASGRR